MIKKYVRRYRNWQRNVPLTSAFVTFCGIIAVVYFFYRIILVVSPTVVLEQSIFNPTGDPKIVCGEDEGSLLQDPTPIFSAAYQKRIHNQPALTSNEVVNPDLTQINPDTGQPVGYSHSIESPDAEYALLQDTDGTSFLRTATAKFSIGNAQPAWQSDLVDVAPDHTYGYSFWYRSTIPLHVSTEYIASGKASYGDVTTLQPTSSWQQFAAYFDNDKEATQFTINLSGTKAGQTDIRSLDIHQIPDAKLDTGLVSVTFDDGWQSVSDDALSLLQKYKIRTTQYIISDVAAHAVEGYMNFSTVTNLKKSGAEIGSHSLRHCDQTTLNPTTLQKNAIGSKRMLERQKLGPIKSFAYPLGQYNTKTQAIYQNYYPLIRSSDFGYNDRYFDESNIHSIGVLSTTSDKEFLTWINYAKSHKLWLVLVYHKVNGTGKYSVSSSQLERQLRVIVASGMKSLPLSEAAAIAHK